MTYTVISTAAPCGRGEYTIVAQGLTANEAVDYASLDDPATLELHILDSDGYREGYRNWVMQQRDNEWRDK